MKRLILLGVITAFLFSCEDDALDTASLDDSGAISVVSVVDLPLTAQSFIEQNFIGEPVVSANSLVGVEAYDALLANQLNLVFDGDGALVDFAEEEASVNCDRKPRGKGKGGKGMGHEGDHPPKDSTRAERPIPTEIAVGDLPADAQNYISTNYPDSTVIKVLSKAFGEEGVMYKALIANIGALIFDSEGAFIELFTRGGGSCTSFEEIAVEDLLDIITSYISDNYPDNEIARARSGSIQNEARILVNVDEIGVLIFDESGTFVELQECGMGRK